uniref:Galectin n=1 Tax=Romanomermis culicivorax TaxID=13658 RepID=A0A915JSZ9_ROMCU
MTTFDDQFYVTLPSNADLIDKLNAKIGAAIVGTDVEIIFSYNKHRGGWVNLKKESGTSLLRINLSNPLMQSMHTVYNPETVDFWVKIYQHSIQDNQFQLAANGCAYNLTLDANNNPTSNVVAPINLISKTFFEQIKIYLNGKLISESSDRYTYRAYLEMELNYGGNAKSTH